MIVSTLRKFLDKVESGLFTDNIETFEVKVDVGPGCACCTCGYDEKRVKLVKGSRHEGRNIILETEA